MSQAGPMSPCINICSLDERGFCRGCYRSRDEIASWIAMTPDQRWEVLRESEARRHAAPRRTAG